MTAPSPPASTDALGIAASARLPRELATAPHSSPSPAAMTGFGTPMARAVMLVVWTAGLLLTVYTWSSLPHQGAMVVALVGLLIGILAVSVPGDEVPGVHAWTVATVPAVSAAAALAQLDSAPTGPIWLVQMSANLAGILAARDRRLLACVAAGAMAAVTAVWASHHGVIGHAPTLLAFPLLPTACGLIWNAALRRGIAATLAHRQTGERLARERAATEAAASRGSARMRQIAELTRPLLIAVADGAELEESRRTRARILEAAVRDRIRAPRLTAEPLASACEAARQRGVDVVMLDDGGSEAPLPATTIEWAARLVSSASTGRVTVRVLPPGRDTSLTVLIDSDEVVIRRALESPPAGACPQF